MKKSISYILLALLITGFTAPVKVFSQTDQQETINSVKTKSDEKSSYVKGITPGRAFALVGGVVGLASLVIGWRAKARSKASNYKGRSGAMVALALGVTSIVLSIVHLSTSAGAVFGSGSGKAGALVALVLASIGISFSWLTFRSRKSE
jgi:hypothetical protein